MWSSYFDEFRKLAGLEDKILMALPIAVALTLGGLGVRSYVKGKRQASKDADLLEKALAGDQKAIKDLEAKMVKPYVYSQTRAKKYLGKATAGDQKAREKVRRRLEELHGAYSGLKEVKPMRLGIPLTLLGGARR